MSKHQKQLLAILLAIAVFVLTFFGYNTLFPLQKTSEIDTVPKTYVFSKSTYESWGAHPVEFYAQEYVSKLSLEDQVRSLLFLNYPGTDVATLQNYVATYRPGGFILMGSNIPATPEELLSLSTGIKGSPEFPLFIAIDEEGGDVTRLPYDTFQGANSLRNEPPALSAEAFNGRGLLLSSVGVNTNFGVVADITGDPYSFIYSRSFGADPASVSERVLAAVEGEKPYVLSTIKHYPGHGSAPGDSHFSIPKSPLDKTNWSATDAIPFQAGIDAGATFVMFGHLSIPAVDSAPASLSAVWHDILKTEQGFNGISITDDMVMLENSQLPEYANSGENAVRALEAGNEMLLFVPSINFDPNTVVNAVLESVNSGRLSSQIITEAAIKVAQARRELYPGAKSWIPPCDLRCYVWGDS